MVRADPEDENFNKLMVKSFFGPRIEFLGFSGPG